MQCSRLLLRHLAYRNDNQVVCRCEEPACLQAGNDVAIARKHSPHCKVRDCFPPSSVVQGREQRERLHPFVIPS
jgi:hypothetical protein